MVTNRVTVRKDLWLACFLLVTGLLVTLFVTLQEQKKVKNEARKDFDFACSQIQLRIEARMSAQAQLLLSAAAVFNASDTVTREEWHTFSEFQRVENVLPGLQGLGFAQVIPREQLPQHVEEIRSQGFPDYTVQPEGNRELYTSIIYLEPFSGRNLRAFGYDMFFEPMRRQAMERARDLNAAVLSGKVTLVQEDDHDAQAGTAMYVPVYRNGMATNTVAQRRAALLGWVYSSYRMDDFMRGILGGWEKEAGKRIRLQIYDNEHYSPDALLHDSKAGGAMETAGAAPGLTLQVPISFNDHSWYLRFTDIDNPSGTGRVYEIFIAGSIISLLLFGLALSLVNTRTRAQQLAESLTADLRESEEKFRAIFSNSEDGILFSAADGRVFSANNAACKMLGSSEQELCEGGRALVLDVTDPELLQALAERARTGRFFGELNFKRRDGSLFPVELSSTLFSLQNKKIRSCTIFRDITDRRQAEEMLRTSEQRFRRILQDVQSVAVQGYGPDGTTQYWNHASELLYGYSAQEAIGRNLLDLIIPPEMRGNVEQAIRRMAETGQPIPAAELSLMCKDGSTVTVFSSHGIIDIPGRNQELFCIDIDLTERKEIENALRLSEEKFRTIIHDLPVPMALNNEQQQITFLNPAFVRTFGYTPDDIPTIADWWPKAYPDPAYRQGVLDTWQTELERMKQTGSTFSPLEVTVRCKDGSDKTVLASAKSFSQSIEGNHLVVLFDISQRKRAEMALVESEEKYRRIFENQLLAICIWDLESFRFIDINDTLVQLYGYSREELLGGMTIHDLSAEPEASSESIRQIRDEGTTFIPLRYHKKKDGTIFPVEIVGGAYLFKGRQVVYGLVRDITRRKRMEDTLQRSQERLALAMKASPDAIWDWDLLTDAFYYSPRWWAMVGYEVNELAADSSLWRRLMHPEDLERADTVVNEALAEKTSFELETRLLHKQGHYVPVLTRGFILRDTNDKAVRASGTNTDLTERKKFEEEQRQWERQWQQLQKAESLNRMAGAIAHHFNNLLGAVMGNLEIAMEELPRKGSPFNFLSAAVQAVDKATEVSGLMLTYLGQSTTHHEPLNLSVVCRSSLPPLQDSLRHQVVLEADFPAPGAIVNGNASQIQRILRNLVINASEAIGDNQGTIALALTTISAADIPAKHRFPLDWQPKEECFACLEVKDTGSGIANQDIEKLFDPFFSSKFTGRGLGLSVVLGILRSHLGGITVTSEIDRGSSFRVYLPVSTQAIPLRPETANQNDVMDIGGTVLLIEDDKSVRDMSENMLTRLGFTVLTAPDGIMGVEMFRRHRDAIRVVLCDLTMPRMDGWETLAALRALTPGIPAILASGYDEAQVMAEAHEERPQAFLQKPFKKQELQRALATALKSQLP